MFNFINPHHGKRLSTAVVYLAPLGSLLALGLVMNLSNPLNAGPGSILLVFTLLYLLILTALTALLRIVGSVLRMLKPQQELALKRGYYVLTIIALAPVLLIALNTLGQLELLEVLLILLLVGLGCFYVVRRTAE